MSKLTWGTDSTLTKAELGLCSCDKYPWGYVVFTTADGEDASYWTEWGDHRVVQADDCPAYCQSCGDRLNSDGTVDSRAELEADADRWRAAQNKETTP